MLGHMWIVFPSPFLHIKRLEFIHYKSQNPNMAAKHWGAFEERRKPGGKGHLLPARALDSLAQLQGAGGEWGRSGGAQEGQGKKCQWDDAI